MEKDTLRRAADTISDLLKAHVSDSAEPVDVHEAMAVRDELRELSNEHFNDYDLPEVGDIMVDTDNVERYGTGRVEVVEVLPNHKAETYYVDVKGGSRSVAYMNPDFDPLAPIVKATYVDGSDKVYSFPADRLEPTGWP